MCDCCSYPDWSPEVLGGMPGKVDPCCPVVEKEETNSMAKGVKNHMDFAKVVGDQLWDGHQCDSVAGVGAGHPVADCVQSSHQEALHG